MSGQNWMRGRTIVYNPVIKPTTPAPKRFHIGKILWEALKRTAMLVGFVMLFSMLVGIWAAGRVSPDQMPTLPDKMVLLLDMTGEVNNNSKPSQYLKEFGFGQSSELTVPGMVDAIDAGARDKRVQALSLFLGDSHFDISDLQELRAAIMRFRASGKPVSAYADSFGGNGSGLGLYYLASASTDIWMQPVGVVAIPGMSAQLPFFRGLFEKVGIQPQFFQRKEYKTAMEHFTSREMSPQSREQMEELVKELGDQIAGPIKTDRKQVSQNFQDLIDQGLFTDEEALKLGLVDHLDYRDVYVATVRKSVGGDDKARTPDFVTLEQYASVPAQKARTHSPKVARITVEGMIVEGSGGGSPLGMQEKMATSGDIAAAIMEAAEDKSVKAILLRVNSPGGTPTAAETIHRALVRAKTEFKKPVIVSMGNMAASGGYWISAPADRIYALPATLTGSIGVVGGKFDASGLWDKLDVNWEEVNYGKNSAMWSFNSAFSPSAQERFENSLDSVYAAFTKRVVDGRKLTPEQVEKIAKGHVWTGRQAKDIGLVDVLGGEDVALNDLAIQLGRNERADLTVIDLPKPESKFQALMNLLAMETALSSYLPAGVLEQLAPALVKTDGRLVYQPGINLR